MESRRHKADNTSSPTFHYLRVTRLPAATSSGCAMASTTTTTVDDDGRRPHRRRIAANSVIFFAAPPPSEMFFFAPHHRKRHIQPCPHVPPALIVLLRNKCPAFLMSLHFFPNFFFSFVHMHTYPKENIELFFAFLFPQWS